MRSPDLDMLFNNANALLKGPAVSQSNGLLCHVATCTGLLHVGAAGNPRTLQCRHGHVSTVTAAQYKTERRRLALGRAEIEAQRARAASVPRYPVCGCGGPLMLPEQAGKPPKLGHLLCGQCGPLTGATIKGTPEQIAKARAAATAEGFEVKS